MRQASCLLAAMALTLWTTFPNAARADVVDDLDVTMQVLDDIAEIDEQISAMPGPGDDLREDLATTDEDAADGSGDDDPFDHDGDWEREFSGDMDSEADPADDRDVDLGEDIDDDRIDEGAGSDGMDADDVPDEGGDSAA